MDSNAIAEVLEKTSEQVKELKEVGLIKNGKLNLNSFNDNVQTVADNLGAIIPDIVEISKEQVAIINHGLEGVMSFVRTFQITNTYVAVLFNSPDKLNKISYSLSKVQDLENRLLKDVRDTLINLDLMLEETFKETAQYYSALAQIIYSEEKEGTIEIKYERSERLKEMMSKIYKRKTPTKKESRLKKSLGLVQIIDTLDNLNKTLNSIKIDEDTILKYYEVKGYSGKEEKTIKLNIDILESLKGISRELVDSLRRVGVLTEDESKRLNVIKGATFEQQLLAKYNKKNIEEALKGIKVDKGIVDHFKELLKIEEDLKNRLNRSSSLSDKEKIISKIKKLNSDKQGLKNQHDNIIKREVKIIHNVITAFTKIVSLWGYMVDNEIHIGQVAQKAAKALEELTKLELKLDSDLNKEPILIAIKTQESIAMTCNRAKELKTTGKVMNMLLRRLKYVVSFNDSLERYVHSFEDKIRQGENYVYSRVKEANKAVIVGESKTNEMVNIMREFNAVLEELSNERNMFDTERFVNELSSKYGNVTKHINDLIKRLKETKSSNEFKDIEAFMKFISRSFVDLLKDLNGFSKTFKDDFKKYERISDLYSRFIRNMARFLDAIDYSLKVQERLLKDEVSYKALNYRIKAFQSLFENLKKSQKEQMRLDSELAIVMNEVGMTKDYFSEYKKMLGEEFNRLLNEMNDAIKDYFSDRKLMEEQYRFLNHWLSSYRVDFSRYNKELSEIKIGFFDRLFNRSKFKDFGKSLSLMNKSLVLYDHRVSNLSKIKLGDSKDIGEFSDNVVIFVNEFMDGFLDLMKEVYNVLGVLNEMLSRIDWLFEKGYIAKFQSLISKMEELNMNNKLSKIDLMELSELKGLDVKRLRELFEGKPRVRDYNNLVSSLHQDYESKVQEIERLKKRLKCAFVKLLINAYVEWGGDKKDIKSYVEQVKKMCNGID